MQDFHRVSNRRFLDIDRLEAALQSRILFDVLTVFIRRGSADSLQLAASQSWLKQVAGTHRATLRGACAHNLVDLIDEEDDVAAGLHFFDNLLELLFEVAAVASTGDHRTQIQGVNLLALQGFWHILINNLLSQAFNNSSLTHAWVADEHRVVLGTTRQHRHHAQNFRATAHHRVKLAFCCQGSEVTAKLVEQSGASLLCLRGNTTSQSCTVLLLLALVFIITTNKLDNGRAQLAQIDVHLGQNLWAHAFAFANKAQKNVLCADVVVTQLQSFPQAQFQHLASVRSEGDVSVFTCSSLADHGNNLLANAFRIHAVQGQRLSSNSVTFLHQAEQEVLGADVVVMKATCFGLRQDDHSASSVSKPFEHVFSFRLRLSPSGEDCHLLFCRSPCPGANVWEVRQPTFQKLSRLLSTFIQRSVASWRAFSSWRYGIKVINTPQDYQRAQSVDASRRVF